MAKTIPLSIVIPVYNEGENIRKCIEGIEKDVHISCEILLVYDFPADSTVPVVKRLQKSFRNLTLVRNRFGRGALNAIKSGLHVARGEAVLVTMADLSDDPKSINLMMQKFKAGYDVVCGSRYMRGGKKIGGPKFKSFLSWLAGVSAKHLLGLPTYDLTNSFKLYRRSIFREITIESSGGFELGMEIILKAYFLEKKICEVPTIWYDRTTGKSRFNLLAWLPSYVHWYFWAVKKRLFP